MNLGGLDGSVTTLGGRVKLTGKAAGLARRAVYAVSLSFLHCSKRFKVYTSSYRILEVPQHHTAVCLPTTESAKVLCLIDSCASAPMQQVHTVHMFCAGCKLRILFHDQ